MTANKAWDPYVVIWLSLIACLNAQYFDPELFEDGKGEVSETSKGPKSPPNLLLQNDDPTDKDLQSVIHTPISNAASKAKEDSTTFYRGIKRKHGVVMERWDGIEGYDIKTLTGSSRFPTLPNYFSYTNDFVEPDNWGDSYGSRLRTYFLAPQTGNYKFWLASDAQGQLYISTDENPKRKVMIAEVSQHRTTLRDEFEKYQEQGSQPVYLTKGHYYYMEVLHKEQFLDDHANVKVQLPDNTTYAPIPSKFLWTLPPPKNVTKPIDDPFVLVRVAARAGAHAGAQLGSKEAAEKGALAGAIEGEKAGMKAGAAAGAIAARKAATAIATKALAEAIKNMTLNRHVFNIYTGNSSVATASATAGAEGAASAGAGGTAGGSAGGQGGGKVGGKYGRGRKRPGSAGSEWGATGGGTGAAKTVIKPKSGQNPQEAARENIDMNGAAIQVEVGAMYIIHSLNIPAMQEFKKNLCWRSTYGDIILGRRCQVFIAREGFISRDDGQQTVAWESACVRGYYIMQKNYHYVLAKLGSSKKFYVDATFTAFRTLKFPIAFMFALLRYGWYICESKDANFHITDLVASYNEASISWIQRCSFVIRPMEKWESAMMNCFDILRSFKTTEQPAITAAATISVPVITTPPPTPAPASVPPAATKMQYMICLRIIFINDAGISYRLISNLKLQGYYVYGDVFELKYVLPKAPNGSTGTKPDTGNDNVVNEEFDRKKNKIEKDGRKRVVGSERTKRSIGDKMHDAYEYKQLGSKLKRHTKAHRWKIVKKMGEAIHNKAESRRSAVPVSQVTSRYTSQRFKASSPSEFSKQTKLNPKKLATTEKGLNEIGQPFSVNGSPKANSQKKTNVEKVLNEISQHLAPHREQSTIFEELPQPRNLIGNSLTQIVFTSLDPSQKFDILLNGKRTLSVIVDEHCYVPVQVVVHVSKVPKPTPAPSTTKPTMPRPNTQLPPPPIPLPPEPPPPLPPPPPPVPITHRTTPLPHTTLPTTPPPPPVTAAPPPIPPPPVQPPPPPLPPPPPPVPPPPPTVIVPVPEGCMHTRQGNSNGKCCKFPFTHRGVQESKCIRGERNFRWCSTTSNYDKDKQWGFCPHCNVARGRTAGGDCCHFPFLFKGKVYQQCVKDSNGKPWCATTYSYDRDQKWGYCGGPVIAKPPPPKHPRPQEIDCRPVCSMICLPSCPPRCCRRFSKVTIITQSDMQKGVNHCTDHCKKSCAPSCPVKCCTLAQEGCPPSCSTSNCCLTILSPDSSGDCPAICSTKCAPNCPVKCCSAQGLCPEGCSPGNCKPICPFRCCENMVTNCPSDCSPSNCRPECPSNCCFSIIDIVSVPYGSPDECPGSCIAECKPECPVKCCKEKKPEDSKVVVCPVSCATKCEPDCPAMCCENQNLIEETSLVTCPETCATNCLPSCPPKCCVIQKRSNNQDVCPSSCMTKCSPECPQRCCSNALQVPTKPIPAPCPAPCLLVCQPSCPIECCLAAFTSQPQPQELKPTETTLKCPTECYTNCTPVVPC